jgi:Insertion element 4 transposase N-terminal/Transposase DDE domain
MARTKAVLGAGARLADHLAVGYLAMNCPLDRVREVLRECGAQSKRRRDLPHEVLVYYVMAMCLYRKTAYEEVLRVVVEGLRTLYGDAISETVASKAAISQGRTRLGAEPLRRLYEQQVGPIGSPGMGGVWYRGLRVMGLDGSTLEVADEALNAAHYGYPGSSRGSAAFPQLRFVALGECGTHVLIGARMAPNRTSEQELARQVLDRAEPSMLILADRGFAGYPLWQHAVNSGARLLFRLRENQLLPVQQVLADGSYLSTLYQNPKLRRQGHRRQEAPAHAIAVRVIEYRLEGAGEGEPGTTYRLLTNWLDHEQAPAAELAALYQRRWKVEVALDEIKTHLNETLTLRSKTPSLVEQEFFALLLAHAAIRRLMTLAAERSKQAPEDLSFTHAIRVLQRRLPASLAIPP